MLKRIEDRRMWRAAPVDGDDQHILLGAYEEDGFVSWLKVKLEAPLSDLVAAQQEQFAATIAEHRDFLAVEGAKNP